MLYECNSPEYQFKNAYSRNIPYLLHIFELSLKISDFFFLYGSNIKLLAIKKGITNVSFQFFYILHT